MTIQQVSERELDDRGIRFVAVPSLEWNGLKYVWLTSYAVGMQATAQKRCQDLNASGRAALMICHNDGKLTIWQGSAGSAQPSDPVQEEEPSHPLSSLVLRAIKDPGFATKVRAISVATPPAQYPKQFINKCNDLANPILGDLSGQLPSAEGDSFEAIVERMEGKVSQVLGAKGAAKVRQYAERYPETEAFLNACRKLLSGILGPDAVSAVLVSVTDANVGKPHDKVITEARQVLEELLGPIGLQLMLQLVEIHPPEKQLDQFLQECKAIAAIVVGEMRARELFP